MAIQSYIFVFLENLYRLHEEILFTGTTPF